MLILNGGTIYGPYVSYMEFLSQDKYEKIVLANYRGKMLKNMETYVQSLTLKLVFANLLMKESASYHMYL
eukprot:snap_masked-scaffold_26-processed-gene-1.33-mRNA-1 protein AED:1.00 eAED:1.00 QI:0/-1/0/0/-1/1/1/0/69